jgi:hypothetical protein
LKQTGTKERYFQLGRHLGLVIAKEATIANDGPASSHLQVFGGFDAALDDFRVRFSGNHPHGIDIA